MSITSRGILSAAYPVDAVIAQQVRDRILDDKTHRGALLIAPAFNVASTDGTYPVLSTPQIRDIDDDPVSPIAFGAPLSDAQLIYTARSYSLKRWDGGKFLLPTPVAASYQTNGMDAAAALADQFASSFYTAHAYKVYSALNATANYNGGASTHQYDSGNVTSATFALTVELQKVKSRFRRDGVDSPNVVVMSSDVFGYLLQNDFVRNVSTAPRQDVIASSVAPLEAFMAAFFESPSLKVVIADDAYITSGTETSLFTGRCAFLRVAENGAGPSWCNTIMMSGESGVDLFGVRSEYSNERDGMWYFSDSYWDVHQGTPTAGVLWKDMLS